MFGREPVAIMAFARAVIMAAVLFGLNLTDVQIVAVITVMEAGLALVTRAQVTPASDPRSPSGEPLTSRSQRAAAL